MPKKTAESVVTTFADYPEVDSIIPTPVHVTTVEEAATLAVGTIFIDLDGVKRVVPVAEE